jgi:hypothetical protein
MLLWFILVYGFAVIRGDIGTYEIEAITASRTIWAVTLSWARIGGVVLSLLLGACASSGGACTGVGIGPRREEVGSTNRLTSDL